MTRRPSRPAERATDREVGVVAAVLVAGSEKAAAHRLGLSHSTVKHHLANARSKVGATTTAQLVWILAGAAAGARGHGPNGRVVVDPDVARHLAAGGCVGSAGGRARYAGGSGGG